MGKVMGRVAKVVEVTGWTVFIGGPSVAMVYMVAKLAMVVFGMEIGG